MQNYTCTALLLCLLQPIVENLAQGIRVMGPYHVVNFIFVLEFSCVFVASVVAASVVVLQWKTV